MVDLMFAFGAASIFMAPFIVFVYICERNKKCRNFIEKIADKYF